MNWFIIHNSSKNESINYQFSFNSFVMIFVMGKVVALWNKTMRPKSSEIIVQGFGRSIERPCLTRWNSEYDCMLMQSTLFQLWPNLQSSDLSLPKLTKDEYDFLFEYKQVLAPIDKCQSEYHAFYSYDIPILLKVRKDIMSLLKFWKIASSKSFFLNEKIKFA